MCSESAKQVRAEGTTKTNLRNQGRHAGWRGVFRLEAAERDIFVGVSGLYTGESRSARRMNWIARNGDPEDSAERGLGVETENEGIDERGSGVRGGDSGILDSRACIA